MDRFDIQLWLTVKNSEQYIFMMKAIAIKKISFIGIFSLLSFWAFSQPIGNTENSTLPNPRLTWWQDARFGMFIHWGPVSLIGKEISWSRGGYGISKYDSLYLKFNPKQFDAKNWVKLAQQAGMKYMVFTAKHHDGFCMWDTKTTDYKITNAPFGRDVCKELTDAAHAANMPVAWYFSPADWKDIDCRNPKTNDVFEKRVLEQVRELLTNYGKIDLLWIDYEGGACPVKPEKIYQLAHKLQPKIIVNNRLDVLHTDESHGYIGPNGDYTTPEGFVAGYSSFPWETCTNLGHQWAWKFNDKPRPIKEAALTLLRCIGGNGNLLLNVGPDSLGVVPSDFQAVLGELGNWIKKVSPSIYGTRGGPYAPTASYVCTQKGNKFYIHVFDSKDDTLILPPLPATLLTVQTIDQHTLAFQSSPQNLKIVIPKEHRDPLVTTIECTIHKPVSSLGIIRPFSSSGSLAYFAKVTASSSVGQMLHDPTAAIDDNESTAWVIGRRKNVDVSKYYGKNIHYVNNKDELNEIYDDQGWLEVDLGKIQRVGRVRCLERFFLHSKITRFEIQYQKDNKWITWMKDDKMGVWEKETTPVLARYFRLVIHKREYMSGIREFQLFPPSMDRSISGIFPSLATFNNEGECGTGAVVEWAGKLWAISYGPHLPFGSSDKLYEISPALKQTIRTESVGGTPASRMIHKESKQLFIGHYVIDSVGNVRVIPISVMPGRLTGVARSVTDPANKVVIATMEEGFYEIDVHSLAVKTLFKDGNQLRKEGAKSYESELLLGVHGKGFYSSQGVYVFSNNGEAGEEARINPRIKAGALYEYDGANWKLIRRNQFTEVTGPGGILGNPKTTDPIWATGWDHKSVILALRDEDKWTFYRLPKSSNSYDGAHGWNTEWPRIRNIGTDMHPDFLMTMHGMFWRFPGSFSAKNTAGISPRSSYLKVIGDFTRWNDQLVFGCDDAAKSEFLNKRKAKGGILGPGQSQSNLWFTPLSKPDELGKMNVDGAVWLNESVAANAVSEPFLLNGWTNKSLWIKNAGDAKTDIGLEMDIVGNGTWKPIKTIPIAAHTAALIDLSAYKGQWIRVKNAFDTKLSLSFVYHTNEQRSSAVDPIFKGLNPVQSKQTFDGLLYSLGESAKRLGILTKSNGYYEMDESMQLKPVTNDSMAKLINDKMAIPKNVVEVNAGGYVITDEFAKKWCLPLGNDQYQTLIQQNQLRICREVATERDLFNCGGTFYELPSENAGGYAKMKPISSHSFAIHDYNSYRGMLIMTGMDTTNCKNNKHIFLSADKKAAVWAGVIDDLWKLGKPIGKGGPWVDARVAAQERSNPFLFTGYDKRSVRLSHRSKESVSVTIEMDPLGEDDWVVYKTIQVKPNESVDHIFPTHVQARWIRFSVDKPTTITTWLNYK